MMSHIRVSVTASIATVTSTAGLHDNGRCMLQGRQTISAYGSSVGRSEGKRVLGNPRGRGADRRAILKQILKKQNRGGGGVDWTHLAQDTNQRRVRFNTAMNVRGAYKATSPLSSWAANNLAGRTLPHAVSYVPHFTERGATEHRLTLLFKAFRPSHDS
jgi:hypothetical protein